MFTLILHRLRTASDCVLGSINVNGVKYHTLEPSFSSAHPCIPVGSYKCSITYSSKFKRFLPLLDVPGRSGIRIHAGNYASDTHGCILVGCDSSYLPITNLFGDMEDSYTLFQSMKALDSIMAYFAHAKIKYFILKITDS